VAETVGWLVDKITIIELKIYHMREQAARDDISPEFRARCEQRLEVMREQRDDLAAEVTKLVADRRPCDPEGLSPVQDVQRSAVPARRERSQDLKQRAQGDRECRSAPPAARARRRAWRPA